MQIIASFTITADEIPQKTYFLVQAKQWDYQDS